MTDDTLRGDIPWHWPVTAAIVGALIVAAFVIYAIVAGPTADPASGSSPVFGEVSDQIGQRAAVARADTGGARFFVSSVVLDGSDPTQISPVEIAGWTLTIDGTEQAMSGQAASDFTPGGTTVWFDEISLLDDAVLKATPVTGADSREYHFEIDGPLPVMLADHRIPFDSGVFVVDELWIDDGFGSMTWHIEGGIAIKAAVRVTIPGTDEFMLVTSHETDSSTSTPLWSRSGVLRLVAEQGPSLSGQVVESIAVGLVIDSVATIGNEVETPIAPIPGP